MKTVLTTFKMLVEPTVANDGERLVKVKTHKLQKAKFLSEQGGFK
jgi:hypothetical protein